MNHVSMTTVPATVDRATPVTPSRTEPVGRSSWPLDRRDLGILAVAYAALVGVGALVGTFLTGWAADSPLGRLDIAVSEWFAAQRTDSLNTLTNIGSGFSDTLTVVVALAVLAGLFALLWRRWDEITLLATALALEVTSFVSIAYVVGRNRPPIEQLDPSPPTSGFPSGHTAAALALYVGLALIVAMHSHRRIWHRLAAGLAGAAVVAVAVSRMYRGMHFLTDVTFGALLGAACLAVAWYVVRPRTATPTPTPGKLVPVEDAR